MAYKPNIPAATDKLSVSQGDIQGNFGAIDDGNATPGIGFAFDHVTLAAVSNVGKHKKVTFPSLSGATLTAAEAATSGNELRIYNNSGAIYLNNNSADNFNVTGATNSQTNGFMYTWSGHVIRWGELTATGTTTVSFPTAFGATPTTVMLTVAADSAPNRVFWNPGSTTSSVLGVKVTAADGTTSATATFYFWAFGAR